MPEVPLSSLKGYVVASVEALTTHGRTPYSEVAVIITTCFQSAAEAPAHIGRLQLVIHSVNPESDLPPVLWEIIESTSWTRELYTQLVSWLSACEPVGWEDTVFVSEVPAIQWREEPPVPQMKPLWRYHPLRLAALMPWGPRVAKASMPPNGVMTQEAMTVVQEAFKDGLNHFRFSHPLRTRLEHKPDFGRATQRYAEVLINTAGFFATGKQIFDFPPELSQLFKKTDVDDISMEHVKLPYPVIYLHFGPQADIPLGDGWFAEGAYLAELRTNTDARHINISVVSGHESLARYLDVDQGFEPSYSLGLGPTHQSMALAEAIDLVLADKLNTLKDEIENEPIRKLIEAQIRSGDLPSGAVSVQKRNAQEELSLLMPRHEAFKKILRLAVNALVYINAYPDDIETRWPANTSPSKLRELAKAKDKKEKARVMSELARAGFTPVHLCGKQLVAELEKQESRAPGGDRTVAMHWVRGHWRRQVHGPGRTLRKLIWRMPLLRGTRQVEEADTEPAGHVYLVT